MVSILTLKCIGAYNVSRFAPEMLMFDYVKFIQDIIVRILGIRNLSNLQVITFKPTDVIDFFKQKYSLEFKFFVFVVINIPKPISPSRFRLGLKVPRELGDFVTWLDVMTLACLRKQK